MSKVLADCSKPLLSFEFFPPQTDRGMAGLLSTAGRLAPLGPDFFSVTYGAGGSTRDRTVEAVTTIHRLTGVNVAPHISCVGDSVENLKNLLQHYQLQGIDRVVALRGDLPSGMGYATGDLHYANELVSLIRQQSGEHFHIEVAAYPESHPQALHFRQDLNNFKRKVEAGANSAITQFFFNAEAYFAFVEDCLALGIDIPIVPGIMPILNYAKLARFSEGCGAEIPRWMRRRFESYRDDAASIRQFGEECIIHLCETLLAQSVPGLHFYTLNQADLCLSICRALKLA